MPGVNIKFLVTLALAAGLHSFFSVSRAPAQTGTSLGEGYAGYHEVPKNPPPRELKVLTCNIGCVTPVTCNDSDLSAAAASIAAGSYDIVFVQEAFWGDDARKVAERSGFRYWVRGPKGSPTVGSGGTIIMSKHPFESYGDRKYSSLSSPDDLTNKGVQEAILNIGKSTEFGREVYWQLAVSNTHMNARNPGILGGYEEHQRSNVDEWLDFAETKDRAGAQWLPRIGAGDFNFAKEGWAKSLALDNYFESQSRSRLSLANDYLNCRNNSSCTTDSGGGRDPAVADSAYKHSVAKMLSRSGEYLDVELMGFYQIANPVRPDDHAYTALTYRLHTKPRSDMQRVTTGINLMGNYPNPAQTYTNIPFRLNGWSEVSLEIYSITGERVRTVLDNKSFSAGDYTERIDLSGLASGPYLYRFTVKPDVGSVTVVNAKFLIVK